MTWWAPTVLGGDEPMDLLDDLTKRVGVYGVGQWSSGRREVREAVQRYGSQRYVEFILHSVPHDPKVAAQVVALLHMAAGVKMSLELEALALQGCRHGHLGWSAPWFFRRQAALAEFAELIEQFQRGRLVRLLPRHIEPLMGLE